MEERETSLHCVGALGSKGVCFLVSGIFGQREKIGLAIPRVGSSFVSFLPAFGEGKLLVGLENCMCT